MVSKRTISGQDTPAINCYVGMKQQFENVFVALRRGHDFEFLSIEFEILADRANREEKEPVIQLVDGQLKQEQNLTSFANAEFDHVKLIVEPQ